jgi:hypothetical protein
VTTVGHPPGEVPGPFSLWLVPAPELQSQLAEHIVRICQALGCVSHHPHVTVLGDVRVERAAAEAAIEATAKQVSALTLKPRCIASSPSRFEALTVRFHPSAALDALRAALHQRLGLPPDASAEPHLSLAYPRPPFHPSGLPSLAMGIPLATDYRFDRLALIDPGTSARDWEDVGAWRVIRSSSLRG